MKLGEFLLLCREAKGLPQSAVAKHLGVSKSVVSRAENGHFGLTLVNAVALCDLYGIGIEMLAVMVRRKK